MIYKGISEDKIQTIPISMAVQVVTSSSFDEVVAAHEESLGHWNPIKKKNTCKGAKHTVILLTVQ